jgi:thioredoxin 1
MGLMPANANEDQMPEGAAERPDVRFLRLDVDANQKTTVEHGVLSMPTLLVFRGGQEIRRLVGARPRRRLVQELEPVLGVAPVTG